MTASGATLPEVAAHREAERVRGADRAADLVLGVGGMVRLRAHRPVCYGGSLATRLDSRRKLSG